MEYKMAKITLDDESYFKFSELKAKFKKKTWRELIDFIHQYQDKLNIGVH